MDFCRLPEDKTAGRGKLIVCVSSRPNLLDALPAQIRAIISPPTAVNTTTSQGGHFQNIRSPKATSPSPKSAGEWIALVQTGVYNAVNSSPTTAALTPFKADWKTGTERRRSQSPSIINYQTIDSPDCHGSGSVWHGKCRASNRKNHPVNPRLSRCHG